MKIPIFKIRDIVRPVAFAASLLTVPFGVFAKGTISGQAINKSSGEPIDYAVVQLIDAKTSKLLPIGTNTDAEGKFIIPDVADGKYIVKISNLGSTDLERKANIDGSDLDLGVLRLADDTKMLQEVVVEGVRSQMRFELDKKVFQVDANIAAAGQSASELLESIPSVEVDQDGEVSLRGDSSVTVWINGKESGLTADNRAQILEQLPAETIEKIEVITNPSAKYSAEGTQGIINIVLKKDRRAGYFGSAELGGNSRGGGNVGFNINVNSGKWDSFAGVGFRMRHMTGGSESRRIYDDGSFLDSEGTNRNHGNNIFVRAGTTYNMTSKDAFSLTAFGMFGHRWGRNETDYTSNLPGHWVSDLNSSHNKSDNRGANVMLGYTHRFADDHTIEVSLSYNHWGGPIWNSYLQQEKYDDPVIADNEIYQEQNQNISLNSIEAKLDYSVKLNKWLKLDAGYNGNYSHENTPVSTYKRDAAGNLVVEPALYNDFLYSNNISALYATLGGKIRNFSFSAGLRSEAWQVRTKSLGYGESKSDVAEGKINKIALFPSAFLSWSLPYDNELQVNYTRRIRRPWGGMLNSFVNISDPANITYGNPDLQPQYSNAFELNYIKTWRDHMISVSGYLRTSSDLMERISYLVGGTMYTTNANVSSLVNSGVELVVKNTFFNGKLTFTTTGNLYDSRLKGWETVVYHLNDHDDPYNVSGPKRNSFAWDVREMISAKLPWGLSLQATGRYASGNLSAQGRRNANWSVDAGIRKIAGDWSISLNCRDVFDSRKFSNTTYGETYTLHNKRWRGGRTLSLTVKYSFGNMRAKKQPKQMEDSINPGGYGNEEMMD